MIKIYDIRCTKCEYTWEHCFPNSNQMTNPECPKCGMHFTVRMPGGLKDFKAKDPYDYLDGPQPETKRIFSGPKVHSK